jgi:hypothetical protein
MARFALEQLDLEERAFVEYVEGLHRQIETLKLVFPPGRLRLALGAMQEANTTLVAAAISLPGMARKARPT